MQEYSGKQTERMKTNYNAAIKQKIVCSGLVCFAIFTEKETWHIYSLAGDMDWSVSCNEEIKRRKLCAAKVAKE